MSEIKNYLDDVDVNDDCEEYNDDDADCFCDD